MLFWMPRRAMGARYQVSACPQRLRGSLLKGTGPLFGFEALFESGNKIAAGLGGTGIHGKTGVIPKLEHDGWTGLVIVNVENGTGSCRLDGV